jgi:YfiH family protein
MRSMSVASKPRPMMFDTSLPQPNDSFRWVQAGPRPALVCLALEPFAPHLFTTREWRIGARDERSGWIEIAGAMDVDQGRLVHVHQVHGADVVVRRAGETSADYPSADIIVSNDSSAALAIQTADCVSILLADRRNGAVAAAHAGWRGLAARVPSTAVEALAREFGSHAADLVAAVGPSIGACCYEVGADVRHRFDDAGFSRETMALWFSELPQPTPRNPSMAGLPAAARPNHWYFDSGTAARDALVLAGVPFDQIFAAGLCTARHPDAFCSYRRDGTGAGRLAGAIRPRGGRPDPPLSFS